MELGVSSNELDMSTYHCCCHSINQKLCMQDTRIKLILLTTHTVCLVKKNIYSMQRVQT
jgi:hypothetical protein